MPLSLLLTEKTIIAIIGLVKVLIPLMVQLSKYIEDVIHSNKPITNKTMEELKEISNKLKNLPNLTKPGE